MFEFLRQLGIGIRDAWRRLSLSARVNIALAALASLAVIVAIVIFGTQPRYVSLYSRLSLEDSGQIVTWLEEQDIPYRVRDGGRSIDVAVQNVSQAKVGLAEQNLPRSHGLVPGFELFDQRDLLTNQYLQNVDFMRALNGELQRQLNQFDFVRNSSVFISRAQERLFISEQEPSEAAITVDVIGGGLTRTQVQAILHTVSTFGGAELSPANVSVVGTDGTIFHSPATDQFAALAGSKLETQVEWEEQKETKLREVFRSISPNSSWAVNVTMDWSEEERTTKEVSRGATTSFMETTSETTTRQEPPEGAPGARANIPDELAAGPGAQITTTSTTETIDNTEPSVTNTTVRLPAGRVTNITVSGIIEGEYQPVLGENGEETGEQEYLGFTDEQMSEYRLIAANAVGEGVSADDIHLIHAPFRLDRLAPPVAAPTPQPFFQQDWFRLVLQAILVVLALVLLRFFARRAMEARTIREEEVRELPEASPSELRQREIADEVERLSQQEPQTVAALLRSWMGEEES